MRWHETYHSIHLVLLPIVVLLILLFSSGCSKNHNVKVDNFSKDSEINIKKKSKLYTITQLSQSRASINSYVAVRGKITKKDTKGIKINKGDRFILQDEHKRVQVLASNNTRFCVGQRVVVYGEYYGLIKSYLIELN